MLQQILTVSTSSYPQFTPINAQVQDVTYYLGWLKMQTAAPKAVVATLILLTAGLAHHTQLAGPDCFYILHILLVCDFVCPITLCTCPCSVPEVFLQQNDDCHSDVHTHAHTHTYTHAHTCTHIPTNTHTHAPTYTLTHIQTHMHTHVHTYTQTHIHMHLHTPSHTYKHTCTHTNTIHTHTYTQHNHTHPQGYKDSDYTIIIAIMQ